MARERHDGGRDDAPPNAPTGNQQCWFRSDGQHELGPTHVGIDENGLGPRLGPLVVTAVYARATAKGAELALRKPRGAMAQRLGDSKDLVSWTDHALGEAWARALVAREGLFAQTPDALVQVLSLDRYDTLRRPCPTDHAAQCWDTSGEGLQADAGLVAAIAGDLAKLEARGLSVLGVRLAIVCTHRLNEAAARGVTRFACDLHAMERLALAVRETAGQDLLVTCGKVGGYDRYAEAFGPLSGRLYTTVREGRARSEYRIAGLGRIAFVRDADARHPLVCMASLVGKWARDLLTARVIRYHRAHDPSLTDASGYHDPVTTRFIEASRLSRRARGVKDACFERTKAATD